MVSAAMTCETWESAAILMSQGRCSLKCSPVACVTLILMIAVLASCATRPAPDIGGRWKAVNRFADAPQEIPLYQSYVFYPSPMDATLKNMLTRWAKDSGMTLSYKHPSDFTLHAPVAQLRTGSLQDAAALLTSIYAAQRVAVTVDGNQIMVRAADTAAIEPMAADAESEGIAR